MTTLRPLTLTALALLGGLVARTQPPNTRTRNGGVMLLAYAVSAMTAGLR